MLISVVVTTNTLTQLEPHFRLKEETANNLSWLKKNPKSELTQLGAA